MNNRKRCDEGQLSGKWMLLTSYPWMEPRHAGGVFEFEETPWLKIYTSIHISPLKNFCILHFGPCKAYFLISSLSLFD